MILFACLCVQVLWCFFQPRVNVDVLLMDEEGRTTPEMATSWGFPMMATLLEDHAKRWFRRVATLLLATCNRPGTVLHHMPPRVLDLVLQFLGKRTLAPPDAHVIVASSRPPRANDADGVSRGVSASLRGLLTPTYATVGDRATELWRRGVRDLVPTAAAVLVHGCPPTDAVAAQVEQCRTSIQAVPKPALDELRSLRAPPASVRLVLEAVCVLLAPVPSLVPTVASVEAGEGGDDSDSDRGSDGGSDGDSAGGSAGDTTESGGGVVRTQRARGPAMDWRQRELLAGPGRYCGLLHMHLECAARAALHYTSRLLLVHGRVTFEDVRALVHDSQWLHHIRSRKPQLLAPVVVAALESRYLRVPAFSEKAVQRASSACIPLRNWCVLRVGHTDLCTCAWLAYAGLACAGIVLTA